jgi:peroxiredoxin (alkyl hydroperoxide reductase subunit C)
MNVGRNFAEIIRLIDGLQTADKNGVACPANWVPGEPVIVPAPQTVAGARERLASPDLQVTDWYFSKKTL